MPRPVDHLEPLGAAVALTSFDRTPEPLRNTVDKALRAVLVCTALGIAGEWWVLPQRWPDLDGTADRDLLGTAVALGTLAGAADLDPMDIGPSHTPLSATLASGLAATVSGAPGERIADGVLAGIDVALRLRRTITGTRPGVGFHSPGVFGTVAAAAAAARTLCLSRAACADAVAIALTRAGGLAVNSAATRIGLTHFGWGTAHGLEAALLAAQGWTASHDLGKALDTLFPGMATEPPPESRPALTAGDVIFKHYPCNIYLNLVVLALRDLPPDGAGLLRIDMPLIPHLDNPKPAGVRAARNSAQAVAGIVSGAGTGYAAFCGAADRWEPTGSVTDAANQVALHMDTALSTRLDEAIVRVSGPGGHTSEHAMSELGPWGADHAAALTSGVVDAALVDSIYRLDHAHAFGAVLDLFRHTDADRSR
ncbi:MmgE/PrpD family protein [Actinophytocola sp.]|uniref:MmgE/PrpD family protein n=1 Tax=Actinophytocola sp. TaxID=1872138 RepID=UPI003D6A6577